MRRTSRHPGGDLVADAGTELLYNFNEVAGSLTIADLSGKGHTGTLGVGFAGATAPTLGSTSADAVPEGGSFGLLAAGLLALFLVSRRGSLHRTSA